VLSRQRYAFVAVTGLVTALYVVHLRLPHPERLSDLAQVLVGARAWLHGGNPYQAVQAWAAWPFPLLYPFTAVIAAAPLTVFPTWAAEALFAGCSTALLAWGLTHDPRDYPKLLVFTSAPFIHGVVLNQWSPLLAGAVLVPWAGFVLACKPNIGLALLIAFPRFATAASAAALAALSFLLWPGWAADWRTALAGAPNAVSVIGLPGGVLLLLAAIRWRRPEARLLLAMSVVPHTTLPYEALPLFLIPRTWTEAWVLWAGSAAALLGQSVTGPYASQMAWVRAGGAWLLCCAYLPCLVFVLRRSAPPDGPAAIPAMRAKSGALPAAVTQGIVDPARREDRWYASRAMLEYREKPGSVASPAPEPPLEPWADGAVELSVVIPCLNEQQTIAACVVQSLGALEDAGIAGEVIVSDNSSSDASARLAEGAGARVVRCPTPGYGSALQCGFREARGRFVLMGDGDQSYDFAVLPDFVARARAGDRFIIGTRLKGRMERGAMPLLHRYLGTPVLTWILNLLFGTRISDCNCGLRCVERDTLRRLGVSSPGMEFASEMVVKAALLGIEITEIPIGFYKDRRNRPPHLQTLRDGWRHLRLLLWHAPDHMMTLPGLCMLVLGLPLVLTQLTGPIALGHAHFDIHYMILGVTLSLVGVSATTLGLVIGSTMPRGRVRQIESLAKAHAWFTFDNAAALAGLLFAAGVLCDGFVLVYWLATAQGELTPWFTRLTLLGLVLISVAVQVGLSALLLGTTTTVSAPDLADVSHHAAHRSPDGDAAGLR
jgi:hypothetical protein